MPLFPSSFKEVTVKLPNPAGASPTSICALHHTPTTPPSHDRKLVILIHGYPQNHTLWYETVAEFQSAGALLDFDVLLPDLPG